MSSSSKRSKHKSTNYSSKNALNCRVIQQLKCGERLFQSTGPRWFDDFLTLSME